MNRCMQYGKSMSGSRDRLIAGKISATVGEIRAATGGRIPAVRLQQDLIKTVGQPMQKIICRLSTIIIPVAVYAIVRIR